MVNGKLSSGPIRQALGTMKRHLRDHVTTAKAVMAADQPDTEAELRALSTQARGTLTKLTDSMARVRDKLGEFSLLAKEVVEEQQHFDAIEPDTEDLLDAANNTAVDLQMFIEDNGFDINSPTYAGETRSNPEMQMQSPSSQTSQPPQHNIFKPPKLTLPKFSGDVMDFEYFWSVFEANIHRRTDMTNVEKFSYLREQLEGKAKSAIAGVKINDDNYLTAVDLLKDRYDIRDDRLCTMLYSEFMNIPTCSGKLSDKQDTLDACERVLRQLESTGENVNANRALVVGLLGKFPSGMIRDLYRTYHVDTSSSLNDVRVQLRKSIRDEEATSCMITSMQRAKLPDSKSDKSRTFTNQRYSSGPSDSSLSAVERPLASRHGGSQQLQPKFPCYFCNGDHFNDKCQNFPSIVQRVRRLEELNRCKRCLKPLKYHTGKECDRKIKCVHCQMEDCHVSVLCPVHHPELPDFSPVVKTPASQPSPSVQTPSPSSGKHPATNDTSQKAGVSGQGTSGGVTALNTDVKPALFQTATTMAVNQKTGRRLKVRIALDSLSSRQYIRSDLAERLNLDVDDTENLYVAVFGSSKTLEVRTKRVEFGIELKDGSVLSIEANTTPIICQSQINRNTWTPEEHRALDYFRPQLADDPYQGDGTIDVLIGASRFWELIVGPRMPTSASNLFLIPSKLGLLLSGEAARPVPQDAPTMLCITHSPCVYPHGVGLVACESKFETAYPDIDEFWDLERIGISDDPIESDDDVALDKFHDSVRYLDGRYHVALPWIDEKKALLPTNYDVAYDRLRSLTKRLKSNEDLLEGYRDVLSMQKTRGIIEEVPMDEINANTTIHYLPHHPVLKESSLTTKIRIVYDAASKRNRSVPSLNECLYRGPVILPDLCQLLIRMRTHEIMVVSDIEKAFLQVGLHRQDRDCTRFLWFKDDKNLSLTDNIMAYRFTRVNFGVISSPFLLAATINHHLDQEKSIFAGSLRDEIYVDNVISGLSSADDPVVYYNKLKQLFARAGMNIQEFCSNSERLMAKIPEKDRTKQSQVKVLGFMWDSQRDDSLRLIPSSKFGGTNSDSTKRAVLRAVASVFDPLGFYQPIMLPAKCFLQKLWSLKYDWNDVFPSKLKDEWDQLRNSLASIFDHRIPRFIGVVNSTTQIAAFCDASGRAYATAIYIRLHQPDGSWQCRLIYAKSRLAPSAKKKERTKSAMTLPRLELMGVVIGTRAAAFCRSGLRLHDARIDLFTDSQCVLHWINSRGLLKRFVANRIEEIRKVVGCHFHYVPTAENPADFSTRGKLPEELIHNQLWWNGPTWLQANRTQWPKSSVPPISAEGILEFRSEMQASFMDNVTLAPLVQPDVNYFLGLDPNKMSSLVRLIRVCTICLKFVKIKVWNKLSVGTKETKPRLKALFDRIDRETSISCSDYDAVRHGLIKVSQLNYFPDVMQALQNPELAQDPCVYPVIVPQLGLRLDEEGLIRTHGRFEHSELPEDARSPLLLSKKDRLTTLIIEDIHRKNMHVGVSHTLCLVRQTYWIPQGRAAVRSVIRGCFICRKFKAMPFKLPPMPPWPRERVSRSAPFQFTGLDYFGPITVRESKLGQPKFKMWVCLFTCLVTRAIHLEPVLDQSAQEFLHCLIRFVSRRGVPAVVYSDNAAQFQLVKILGDKAWKRVPSDDTIIRYAAANGLKWKFITELAPWQGGYYERLVGLVKSTLRITIRQRLLTWTDLVTLLTETEAVVNSRPITYINDDVNSRFRVLRPIDFLVVKLDVALTDSPDGQEVRSSEFGEAGKRLVSIWKQRCRTLAQLWRYWYDEYLLSLRERRIVTHKHGRSDVSKQPLVNEVVLIKESDVPRGKWKLAKITKLIVSSDGQIRTAELLLPNGLTIRRTLNLLVPLEIHMTPNSSDNGRASNSTPVADQEVGVSFPASEEPLVDDDEFRGFSPEDIRRTMDALSRYDASHVGVDSA